MIVHLQLVGKPVTKIYADIPAYARLRDIIEALNDGKVVQGEQLAWKALTRDTIQITGRSQIAFTKTGIGFMWVPGYQFLREKEHAEGTA